MDHLRRIVQALRTGSTSANAAVGLSSAQLFVLSCAAEVPTLSVNELAARTATHQSSVSVVVSKLIALGLLGRSRAIDDARVAMISITAKGRAKLSRAPATMQDRLVAALAKLPLAERRLLAHLLGRWLTSAGLEESAPPMFFEPNPQRKPQKNVSART